MGKVAPDATIDASLDYIAGSDYMTVCSGSPTSYTDCYTNALAKTPMASGSFVKADDTSGRKVTMAASAGVAIDVSGSALAVALVNTGDTSVRYVTTCVEQWIELGGTVDFPSWKINIQDPV